MPVCDPQFERQLKQMEDTEAFAIRTLKKKNQVKEDIEPSAVRAALVKTAT